ncbi:hypothetical protein EDF19_2132 [Curtobacterium sp. PhB115]|nr:hypothetical protein EDF19_2132 [Curtobacterium sp. PhB115]
MAVVVLAVLTLRASSVALAGFGLDSLIEIGASSVVLWELAGTGEQRQRTALRLIGVAFAALGVYLLVQSTAALISAHHAQTSVGGIIWTAVTAVVMFCLAAGKNQTGRALGNPVLETEGCEQPRSVSSFSLRSVSGQVVPMTRVLRAASTTSLVMTSSSLIFRTRWI